MPTVRHGSTRWTVACSSAPESSLRRGADRGGRGPGRDPEGPHRRRLEFLDRAGPAGAARRAGVQHGGATPVRSDESLLSADQTATLTAAALKAVPGATVYRVETDAGDGAYEVHLTKDGSLATVKFDKAMTVIRVELGMGEGDPAPAGAGAGPRGPAGPRPRRPPGRQPRWREPARSQRRLSEGPEVHGGRGGFRVRPGPASVRLRHRCWPRDPGQPAAPPITRADPGDDRAARRPVRRGIGHTWTGERRRRPAG